MMNHGQSVEINHSPNQPYTPDHPYRILIAGGSGSGKTNALLNLLKPHRLDIHKIYLNVKDHSFQSINCLLMEEKKWELKY